MTSFVHTCRSDGMPCCPSEQMRRVTVKRQAQRQGCARTLTIDMHCHALVPDVEKLVAEEPAKKREPEHILSATGTKSVGHNLHYMLPSAVRKMTSLDERLADMDALGIDVQLVSPSPTQYYYWTADELAEQVVMVQNHKIAGMCAQHPDRLVGLGTLALQHPKLAVKQLEYAVKELDLRGVEISSTVNGRELSDPLFEPFWAKASELECVVFLHPFGTTLGERAVPAYLSNIVGQPLETTIALSHLIFGGVLDRHNGLKLVAAHGGGYLPSYPGRSDHGYEVRPEAHQMQKSPSDYLRRIWFDTVVHEPAVLRALIDRYGASQIVVGTDYPFDMGQYDIHGLLDRVPNLTGDEREAILGGNAVSLLGIKPSADSVKQNVSPHQS